MSNCYICGTFLSQGTSTNTRCWSCAKKVDSLVLNTYPVDKDKHIAKLEETVTNYIHLMIEEEGKNDELECQISILEDETPESMNEIRSDIIAMLNHTKEDDFELEGSSFLSGYITNNLLSWLSSKVMGADND